jgi:hypothetical protein
VRGSEGLHPEYPPPTVGRQRVRASPEVTAVAGGPLDRPSGGSGMHSDDSMDFPALVTSPHSPGSQGT